MTVFDKHLDLNWASLLSLAIVLLLMTSGCALAPSQTAKGALPQQIQQDGLRWWAARFRIYWPQDAEPDWAADHLLAHAVVAPVLQKHSSHIPLWRFHRRAGRGGAGHQFSFIFFTDARTAKAVLTELERQPATQALLAAGFVEKYFEQSSGYKQNERVQATSDANWSPSMQRNWPVYIMGASALWLGLIDEYARQSPVPADAAGMLSHYRRVEEQMTAQWRAEGMHALFHHLSAVFGYEALPIGDEEVRF